MHSEFRWKQRFEHYQSALTELKAALAPRELDNAFSTLERAGLIQLYEVSFELAWKTLKDMLFYEGFEVNSPRSAIKQAFALGIIKDGEAWLVALEGRNLFSHVYSGELAEKAIENIRLYTPLLIALEEVLEHKE